VKTVLHVLAESEVADAVVRPLPIGDRAGAEGGYNFRDWFQEAAPPPDPAVPADEIAFAVALAPAWPLDGTRCATH
jgi:hypothetical protein